MSIVYRFTCMYSFETYWHKWENMNVYETRNTQVMIHMKKYGYQIKYLELSLSTCRHLGKTNITAKERIHKWSWMLRNEYGYHM